MDQTIEQWRPVVGYEGFYEVSDQGRVRSLDRVTTSRLRSPQRWKGRVLKEKINRNRSGYRQVVLSNGKAVYAYVHRIVLEAFVGPRPVGMEACHNDGDPANNKLSNLRWDTRLGNIADKRKHGTIGVGERNTQARLTATQVAEIRARYKRDSYGKSNALALTREYGITRSNLCRIVRRAAWSHVK